jgi:putative membrane protein (TIGR04086 family)
MIKQGNQSAKPVLYDRVNITLISKGILISYLITIPAFIIFAVVLTYTSFPEKFISTAVTFTTIISVLIAGSTATRNVKSRGWMNGGFVGFIYVLVLYLISSMIFRNFSVDSHVISVLIIGIITGAVGGIVGINLKKNIHSRASAR